jgi:K+-sensing histidine kinase KdpD
VVEDDRRPPSCADPATGPRRRPRELDRWLVLATALVAPFLLAVAWIPVRARFPNADLALILVVAVGAIGALGRRSAVAIASVSAALWFEFFDTLPYDRLSIARSPDIETTLVLALTGVIVGELGWWTVRHRRSMRVETEELTTVRTAAELVASGEELVIVIDAVAGQLKTLLGLASCHFEAPEGRSPDAAVTRDGAVSAGSRLAPVNGHPLSLGLDVVVQHQVLGRFVLGVAEGTQLSRDRLLVAVTLADQVAAAFLAQAPPPLPPGAPEPQRGLRVVTASAAAAEEAPARGQETAGFASAPDRMIS